MQIVILNGGKGKRVKKVSKDNPKCLINFCDKPFLFHQIKLLKKKKIKKFVFCLGYRSQQIKNYLKLNFSNLKKNISTEKKKLGTGGAIINAKKYLDNIFFIIYGDSYLDINYVSLYKKLKKSNNANGLITVINSKLVKDHTPNILIKNKKIIDKSNNVKFNYIDFGLIVLKKQSISKLKLKKFSLDSIILDLIKKNQMIFVDMKKKFYEIGSVQGIKELSSKLNK